MSEVKDGSSTRSKVIRYYILADRDHLDQDRPRERAPTKLYYIE
jgi:hypothetical protein